LWRDPPCLPSLELSFNPPSDLTSHANRLRREPPPVLLYFFFTGPSRPQSISSLPFRAPDHPVPSSTPRPPFFVVLVLPLVPLRFSSRIRADCSFSPRAIKYHLSSPPPPRLPSPYELWILLRSPLPEAPFFSVIGVTIFPPFVL